MYKTKVKTKELFRAFQREGLSQNEAARKAGISKGTMSKAMNGGTISQAVGKQLCAVFGVDPEELLEIVEE